MRCGNRFIQLYFRGDRSILEHYRPGTDSPRVNSRFSFGSLVGLVVRLIRNNLQGIVEDRKPRDWLGGGVGLEVPGRPT